MAEQALFIVSVFVVLTGLVGTLTATLASLNERRREMAILRSVVARPRHVFMPVAAGGRRPGTGGILLGLGLGLMYLVMWLAQPQILSRYGLFIPLSAPDLWDWGLLGAIIMGCVPAWRAYRQLPIDGLSIRT